MLISRTSRSFISFNSAIIKFYSFPFGRAYEKSGLSVDSRFSCCGTLFPPVFLLWVQLGIIRLQQAKSIHSITYSVLILRKLFPIFVCFSYGKRPFYVQISLFYIKQLIISESLDLNPRILSTVRNFYRILLNPPNPLKAQGFKQVNNSIPVIRSRPLLRALRELAREKSMVVPIPLTELNHFLTTHSK